ncbi:MAG: radical SAM protein, partial [Betaproteobacteria bacterium]
ALDAVTPEIFERTRGKAVGSPHRWEKYWQAIEWAAEIFGPEKFGVHLICGMGETEREFLSAVQRIRDRGGHSHLFAFFPEKGSLMEDWPACDKSQWRRVQLARYLIDYAGGDLRRMAFDESGRVTDFGVAEGELKGVIAAGTAFRTSGCSGKEAEDVSACNRPYGDSNPADILSYPFKLGSEDIEIVKHQLQEKKNENVA